ncbi:MAG: glycoside hydrolase family 88/105 protein [Acidobacteriota bacterium]
MKRLLFLILLLSSATFAQFLKSDPLDIARRIADRVISETVFELKETELKPDQYLQTLDFPKVFSNNISGKAIAISMIKARKDTTLSYGISYSSPVKVWANHNSVYENRKNISFYFKEIAYSVFSFQDTFCINLKKGENRVVVCAALHEMPVIFLREITGAEEKPFSEFLNPMTAKTGLSHWLYLPPGKLPNEDEGALWDLFDSLRGGSLKDSFADFPAQKERKLIIHSKATFKKDSFADWNYPNGILMMTMSNLYKATQDEKYKDFLKNYCTFISNNISIARRQYFEDHNIRGLFYRIFRKSMLDDAGAPALPFIELALLDAANRRDSLVTEMVHYVFNEQLRLPDGTFCRPEPEEGTVWADDLFMSVPLLLRAGLLYNNPEYSQEAVKQVLNFNKYLFDKSIKLYKHGYFSNSNRTSEVFWGRANGWVLWATSELLIKLPKDNPSYKLIEQNFVSHLEGILQAQDNSGLWHQVLDDKTSFEETSCTAMFITALARAIINGSISNNKSECIFRAWNALLKKVDTDGIVKDICCGTGIGYTKEFYNSRQRFNSDPRGLGAVITAAIEVDRLNKYLEGIK